MAHANKRVVLSIDLQSDRGATAIIVASAMLVLLGFAAFAVDISAARNEQRLDQAAADAAVLAGAVGFLSGDPTDRVVSDIKEYAQENLRSSATLDWSECIDPDALDEPLQGEGCISIGPHEESALPYRRVRVRVPTQETETTFGRVLGVERIETHAAAEVTFEPTIEQLEVFPAALRTAASPGSRHCFQTSPTSSPPTPTNSCEDTGSATLDWLDLDDCAGLDLDDVIASGPVSLFTVHRSGPDRFGCQPFPNAATTTSATPGILNQGLVHGRLSTVAWPAYGEARINGREIDNRPLWSFIDNPGPVTACADAATGVTTTDDSENDDDFRDAQLAMIACLNNAPEDLFSRELYDSPRLVLLPVISAAPRIDGFIPVFIESVWMENTSGDPADCDQGFESEGSSCRHAAGRKGTMSQPIRSASAVVLSCDALSADGITGAEKCKRLPDDSTVFFEFALSG